MRWMRGLNVCSARWVIIVGMLCLACRVFSGASTPKPEYGKKFNGERAKLGIPVIPDDWIVKDVLGNRITWGYPEYPPSRASARPHYYRKQIVIVDKNIIEETDYYEGANLVTTPAGDHLYDRLDVSCTYRLDNSKGMECTAVFGTGDGFRSISREEAIAILAKWGLPYP